MKLVCVREEDAEDRLRLRWMIRYGAALREQRKEKEEDTILLSCEINMPENLQFVKAFLVWHDICLYFSALRTLVVMTKSKNQFKEMQQICKEPPLLPADTNYCTTVQPISQQTMFCYGQIFKFLTQLSSAPAAIFLQPSSYVFMLSWVAWLCFHIGGVAFFSQDGCTWVSLRLVKVKHNFLMCIYMCMCIKYFNFTTFLQTCERCLFDTAPLNLFMRKC